MPASPPVDCSTLIDLLAAGGYGRGLERLVRWVPETGSTNADLAQYAREGARDRTVLISEHQTAGRGRFQRVWQAPPGASVATSVLVRTNRAMVAWPWLSLLTGVAIESAITELGVPALLKWPNDVLAADGGKLCGILAERVDDGAAVIGFGVNISMDETELPVPTATSLLLQGAQVSKTELLGTVLNRLAGLLNQWNDGDDEALRTIYQKRCSTIGQQVRLLLDPSGESRVEGLAEGVDAHGRIVIDTPAGSQAYSAGDVVHLRG